MWLKKLVGVSLVVTIVAMFGITIGGLGFTQSDKVLVLNPDGTTSEISAAEAAANPNLVEVSSSSPGENPSSSSSSPANNSSSSNSSNGGSSSSNSSSTTTSGSTGATTSGGSTGSTGSTGGATGGSTGGSTGGGTTVSKPVVSLSISPQTITSGSSSTLSWSATNSPTSCTASGSWSGTKSSSGSASTGTKTTGSYSYSLSCSNAGGSGSATVSQTVNAPAVTYCGGLSNCYGVSDMAAHASSSSCWGRSTYRTGGSYARVYNLNNAYNGTSKHHAGSVGFFNKCGQDITTCINGSSGCGSTTLNHSSSDLTKYSSPIGYYDPSKP